MRRLALAAVAAVGLLGAAAMAPLAPAATAPPRGALTSVEYTELSQMISGILAAGHSGTVDWKAAAAACERAGETTPLLATQRSSCVAVMSALSYIYGFPATEQKCSSASGIAARAGDAKTSGDAAELEAFVCLAPDYTRMSRLAAAMYAQDRAARRQALARGFTGVCLATLVDTPAQLQIEQRLASATARLATDAATISRVLQRQLPSTKLDLTQVDGDTKAFAADFEALTKISGPVKLSACPHR